MRHAGSPRRFRDREHAGQILADKLASHMTAPNTFVFGITRGGVVPAAVIARELGLPLDVVIACKLRAPTDSEVAIGALAEGGETFLDEACVEAVGASPSYIGFEVAERRREIGVRRHMFRSDRTLALPHASTAILVDDGIATGSTVMAAVKTLRKAGARHVIVAAPVAPARTAARLRRIADDTVILLVPESFRAISTFYDRFSQVSDEDVRKLLETARGRPVSGRMQAPAMGTSDVAIPLPRRS